MSIFRDTLEADLYRGGRRKAFPLRVAALLALGRGERGCITLLRFSQFCERNRLSFLARWCTRVIERRYGCYIHADAKLGPGLKLPHPIGIVIGAGVVIGARCTIYQNVTMGGRRLGDWRDGNYPQLGDDIVVFAGAVVAGALTIGNGATVGANAVVLDGVPADAVAVGIPAHICDKRMPQLVALRPTHPTSS